MTSSHSLGRQWGQGSLDNIFIKIVHSSNTIGGGKLRSKTGPTKYFGISVVATVLLAGFLQFFGMGIANAAPTGKAMVDTQRMKDASLNSGQVGWYTKGSVLSLVCWKRGQAVQGYFSKYVGNGGWDDLWYKVSDGYFVADIDIDTGSNNPVTGQCTNGGGSTPTASREDRAVSWAISQKGSMSYKYLCQRFVENAFGTSGQYGSAAAMYNAMKNAGKVSTSKTGIPKGAVVYSRGLDANGHVELSIGNGRTITGGYDPKYGQGTVVERNVPSDFLGWSYAPSNWPGR